MIKLTAQIKVIDGGGLVESATMNVEPNNIGSDISSVVGVERQARLSAFSGLSLANDGSFYDTKVDYYVGSVVSDSNGTFATPYELVVKFSGNTSRPLTICFDNARGQHPNTIIVNGTKHDVSSEKITIATEIESTHTIIISNWSEANAPLVITGIYTSLVLDLDYTRIANIEGQHIQRSKIDKPSYGIYSNTGQLQIVDPKGEIKYYTEKRMLQNGNPIELTLENTLNGFRQTVGVFNTTDWDYDYIGATASCTLSENLSELQEIDFASVPLKVGTIVGGEDVYKMFYEATPSKYKFLRFDDLAEGVKARLRSISMPMFFVNEGGLWAQWTKLCELCRGYIMNDFLGNAVLEVE